MRPSRLATRVAQPFVSQRTGSFWIKKYRAFPRHLLPSNVNNHNVNQEDGFKVVINPTFPLGQFVSNRFSMVRAIQFSSPDKPSVSLGLGENEYTSLIELLSTFFKGAVFA